MFTEILGGPAAKEIDAATAAQVEQLVSRGVLPTLAIVRVGDEVDAQAYLNSAVKKCTKVGIAVKEYCLEESVSQEELAETMEEINETGEIHGCLLLLPLPKRLDEKKIKNMLRPEKDIDGMTEQSIGSVFTGSKKGFLPCTAEACLRILDHYGFNVSGKEAVVIGRSLVIGKPLAMELLNRNATVTICHSRTSDLEAVVSRADYVFCATGKRNVVSASAFREGQVVVDVGVNDDGNGGICGDIDYGAVREIVNAATPVPRGVGSVTTSVLASHVAAAAAKISGINIV